MSRSDFFCEDYREFGDVLGDMVNEAASLASLTPADGRFEGCRERLFSVARELSVIAGGLQTVTAITTSHEKPC